MNKQVDMKLKVCLYIHSVVLLRGLPSLDGKNKLFVGKKRKKLGTSTEYWSPRFSSYKGLHSAAGASRAYGA